MDIAQELQKALKLHQAGQLADAADIYKNIIKAHPENADAWNLLSTVFLAAGNLELAVSLAQQATVLAPDFFVPYVNLGNALQASGQFEDAVSAFQKAIALNSENQEVFNNLDHRRRLRYHRRRVYVHVHGDPSAALYGSLS